MSLFNQPLDLKRKETVGAQTKDSSGDEDTNSKGDLRSPNRAKDAQGPFASHTLINAKLEQL